VTVGDPNLRMESPSDHLLVCLSQQIQVAIDTPAEETASRTQKLRDGASTSRRRSIGGGDLASTRRQASRSVRTKLLSPYPGGRAPYIPLLTFYRSFVLAGTDRQHSRQRPAVRAQLGFAASAGADTYQERVPGHNWARARRDVER
jgi:hypothetical protein